MNQTRGFFAGVPQPITREVFELLWSPYFFNFDDIEGDFYGLLRQRKPSRHHTNFL